MVAAGLYSSRAKGRPDGPRLSLLRASLDCGSPLLSPEFVFLEPATALLNAGGQSQEKLLLIHPVHAGRISSHLTLRFLQVRHPMRSVDESEKPFLVAERGYLEAASHSLQLLTGSGPSRSSFCHGGFLKSHVCRV